MEFYGLNNLHIQSTKQQCNIKYFLLNKISSCDNFYQKIRNPN